MRTLRQATLSSAGALALVLGAGSAQADVTVFADIVKEKDVTVSVEISKEKTVDLTVEFDEELESAAEAFSISNQVIDDNEVGAAEQAGTVGENADFGIDLDAEMIGSVLNNSGLVGVNQDVGNVSNQANVVSAAIVDDADAATASFTHSESSVEQINNNGSVVDYEVFDVVDGVLQPTKVAEISGSLNTNSGIIGANQNAGNMANQSNNVAVSIGFGSVLALSEADLGQTNSGNSVDEVSTVKFATLLNSANGNNGIVSGNQNVGNSNNQANSIAFSALTSAMATTAPGTGG